MHHISIIFKNLLVIVLISLLSLTIEAQMYACRNRTTIITNNSTYRVNLNSLLSSLSSTVITDRNGFHTTNSGMNPDMVYGLYLCRGDVSDDGCRQCVNMAANQITRYCKVEKMAVIWYDDCLLRFSDANISSLVAESPAAALRNQQNFTAMERGRFNKLVVDVANDVATQAANQTSGAKKFATKFANFTSSVTLYTLAQCTPDLSNTECDRCLQLVIAGLQSCCSGRIGARWLNPSCNVRYELYLFYNPNYKETEKQKKSNWRLRMLVPSLAATLGLATISTCGFFIWRRRSIQEDNEDNQEVQLFELVGGRFDNQPSTETFSAENVASSHEFPSIHFNILDAATNHFSNENKLGEGGFGSVYKGTLPDGREIAVKRLSITSGQGLVEFKNEVMLIARLQHKNLVRLIGCCLQKNEKLLVYEFMPNRSLDVFLFDSILAGQLAWQKRFSIIKGIARGILYLHEDSRLKIIHRDLKASNVLLDHEMNPKISDFGLARIFGGDQSEANTRRVVGTYGYMAPEYAMQGLFSIKSDVFSFGVLLLEIISGKRNNNFHFSETGETLLTFAWKLWSKGQGIELIHQLIVESCVANEVLKCIHIGLLCVQEDPADRPSMSTVVVMLASDTITLPQPKQPAFSIGRAISEPSQSVSNDRICSINEITITNLTPR